MTPLAHRTHGEAKTTQSVSFAPIRGLYFPKPRIQRVVYLSHDSE